MADPFIPVFRIGPLDCVTLGGVRYRRHEQNLVGGYILARVDDPKVTAPFSHARIHQLSEQPGYAFEKGAFDPGVIKARHEGGLDRLGDLPKKEVDELLWRYRLCHGFLRMERKKRATRSDRSIKAVLPLIQAEMAVEEEKKAARLNANGDLLQPRAGEPIPPARRSPSPRTLRTWLRRLEAGQWKAIALRKRLRLCGDRITQRFTHEERTLLAEYALKYASETRPTIQDIYRLFAAEVERRNGERKPMGLPLLRLPSYHRMCQEIRALPAFDVYAGRHGLPAAMAKFAMVANGADVERPLQRVEIDEWRVELFALCRDAGILERLSDDLKTQIAAVRLWVCAAIDARTRVILGMKMGPSPDASLALEVLEMVVSSKKPYADAAGARSPWDQCGSPETVVHDQARSFLSVVFRRAVIDLEAQADAPTAGLANMRGRVERLFKTVGMQALSPFTGRTFGSINEKGDYDPEKRVSLELPELCRVLVRWSVDVYHNTPHAGLGGETPANAWKRLVAAYGVIPPPDRHVKRAIFGTEIDRVVSAKGVRVLGLYYNCHELQAYRRQHGDVAVEVKVDSMDLGHVSVRVGDAGWLAVPCLRPLFDDVSVETWRIASAQLRRSFAAEARLNDEIVAAAIRDAWEVAAQAQARAGILTTRPTREELDRDEEKLGFGFPSPERLPEGPSQLGSDLTAAAIPTAGGLTPVPSTTAPTRRRGRAVKFED